LGGWKGIRPVKNEWLRAGMVICLGQGAHFHMKQLIPLPLLLQEIQIGFGFTFLVLAHLGSPRQNPEGHQMVVVVVVVIVIVDKKGIKDSGKEYM